jgi:hypothetical protein
MIKVTRIADVTLLYLHLLIDGHSPFSIHGEEAYNLK